MKKTIIVLIVFISFGNLFAGNIDDPIAEAKKIAIGTGKLILVDFTAEWCEPCKMMDRESWVSPEVREMLLNYVFIKVNIDDHRDFAKKHGVRSIPNIFIMDANGVTIYNNKGFLDKDSLHKLLKKYALNMSYLKSAYLINSKKESATSSIRIAQKYQEFSILLDKDLRSKILSLSNVYLDKADKLLKKIENKDLKQKVDLLNLQAYAIKGNYSKVRKKLNADFKKDEIAKINQSLYCFLNYIAENKNHNKDQAQKWLSELNNCSGNKIFLKEIELLNTGN